MSSHREAPEISKDPVADGTDVYAFVNPRSPKRVVLIANFIPLQKPDSGPNFWEFADDVLYEIHIANQGTAQPDVTYQFQFTTKIRNPDTFLYNTGPISSIDSPNWNRPQTYTVTRVVGGQSTTIGTDLACPPVNVGVRSTPKYGKLSDQAVHRMDGGAKVFAGQRADAFHVDLGSIFDLGGLRPFNEAHLISIPNADGVNGTQAFNVHSIALDVPISDLTSDGSMPTDYKDPKAVIGVWATASRQATRVFNSTTGRYEGVGPYKQVSRLANPLFNEVLVPMSRKDEWNATTPDQDSNYKQFVNHPELGRLIPALYPGVFPHLARHKKARADLHAILLTGIPDGVVPGFQNYTGSTEADLLRLNVAIKPGKKRNKLGVVGGDLAGFPNGRRPMDDVTTIELRAIAGLTIPLVEPDYKPDKAAAVVTDGTTNTNAKLPGRFPFLALPGGGYQTKPGKTKAGS